MVTEVVTTDQSEVCFKDLKFRCVSKIKQSYKPSMGMQLIVPDSKTNKLRFGSRESEAS